MGYSPFAINPCGTDAEQSSISARMYMPLAKWALRYTPTPSTAIIYIDPASDPADLITNTCASRAFLARLVTDLNALSATSSSLTNTIPPTGAPSRTRTPSL